ncbi:MAG: tetratricopeptide repeat protein, partial [Bacteroidales bacterium]|nr:tetratricopeptide repeat protein [Bacteroidales bacterium]
LDDFKGAEEDCTYCLERNPYWFGAYQLRGAARQNREDYEGAAADYSLSLEYLPEDKITLLNMGIVNIELKSFDEAEETFQDLLRLYPDYTPTYLMRAAMFLEKGDTINAIQNYDITIEKDPYTSHSFAARGILYLQQEKYNKALADLDEAIRLDPYFGGNYINRGLVRYHLKDLRGAMADYDRVIEMDANNLIARFNRGLLRAQVADNNRAIKDFDKVIELEPSNTIAYLNRAMLSAEINDNIGALEDLNVVLTEHPEFFQGYYSRAQLKRDLNDLRGAEEDFKLARAKEAEAKQQIANEELALIDNPDSTEASGTREETDKDIDKFRLLVVADKKEEEKSKYKSETRGKVQNISADISLEPKFVITFYEKAYEVQRPVYYSALIDKANSTLGLTWKIRATNSEISLNELQVQTHFRSIENYSKLIEETKDNTFLYFGRGIDFMLIQDYAIAIEDFDKVVTKDPQFSLAFFARALARTKQIESNPDVQEARTRLAEASDRMKLPFIKEKRVGDATPVVPEVSKITLEYDVILKDYEKAIDLDPSFIYAYYNRAEILSIQKDYRGAISDYTEAIKIEPQFAEAYFNRGLIKLAVGETLSGLDDLRKAGELGVVESYSIIKRMQ